MFQASQILLISKPVSPPWNDSSKNLVRDLALNMQRYRPVVLSKPGLHPGLEGVRIDEIYSANRMGRFSPALLDNARVVRHLLVRRECDLWHFFFAPNPRTSYLSRVMSRLRKKPCVQTVCSAPRPGTDIRSLLFADRTIVLSKYTEQRLLESGVKSEDITRIPPAVRAPVCQTVQQRILTRERFGLPPDRLILLYPGDLEFSEGAEKSIFALADLPNDVVAHLVMACRAKTAAANEKERQLRELVQKLGLLSRVSWIGETADIHSLLEIADLVLLPSENLYAKMDLPLVLIEAMALQRPVLVLNGTSAAELAENQAALAVDASREGVSAATAHLLRDEQERLQMGIQAQRFVQERFQPRTVAAAYEKVYDEVLNR
jgi:glycosyltransferase involved in cell wall biosynthesis